MLLAAINFFSLLAINIAQPAWDNYESDQEFNYYLGEFVENNLEDQHPMQAYVETKLAESIFDTTDEAKFKKRIQSLQNAFRQYPDHLLRFDRLDTRLQQNFNAKLKRAKRIRWISAAGGAALGALVAIPVGKQLGSQLGAKALLISIPVGALAGAGAGFLLADLLAMPSYEYDSSGISPDLDLGMEEIERALGGGQ